MRTRELREVICLKPYGGAGFESNYCLILKPLVTVLLHHLSKDPSQLKRERHSVPQKKTTTINCVHRRRLAKMAAPPWALALLRHRTARQRLARRVRANVARGLREGSQAGRCA